MTQNTKTTVVFRRLRDTKNTVRFEEEQSSGNPVIIGTLYLQKWFVGDAEQITITIEKEGK